MRNLVLVLFLTAFLAIGSIHSASAEISANVVMQRYGARNLSKNESLYSQNITAWEGNELEFSINIKNTSSNQARGAFLYVYLPIGFPLDSNSVYIDGIRTGGNISNGLYIGNINANSQKDIVFKTKVNNYFRSYAAIQALTIGDNFSSTSRYVSVTKNGSNNDLGVVGFTPSPTPWPTPPPAGGPTLVNQSNILGASILGKNLTKQDANWQKTVKAEPGDLIQFSVMLTANTGATIRNVYLKDTLDSFLDFVYGSVTINNAPASDALTGGQLFIGNITNQEAKFVKFQVRVRNAPQFGREAIVLSSTVQAWAENNSLITNTSNVSVTAKQAGEVKPTVVMAVVKKDTGSGNIVAAAKPKLAAPAETAKTAGKNTFLGGTIAFGSFCMLVILVLLALVILLFTFLVQEKKKNKAKTNPVN